MRDRIRSILEEIEVFKADHKEELEKYRLKYLSKKGVVAELFASFKEVPGDQKREIGQALNTLKNKIQEKFDAFSEQLEKSGEELLENRDLTLQADYMNPGSRHPISLVRNEINEIFGRIGFTIAEGPEIEDDWHNFTALNFPEEHPARDMRDPFFIEKDPDIALRTHTSSVQIRAMEQRKPPIREIYPGRVYRNEAISARAHCFFHQVEGLYVDENVSFADLKQTLYYFAREFFGSDTRVRFRPSYFPFTEPSAEMDISCNICGGKGCNICKYTGWVEILGCGMVDPNVLENASIDSEKYTGFAFGMGIERTTMLKYQIHDIRLFFDNDLRFLKQFTSSQ